MAPHESLSADMMGRADAKVTSQVTLKQGKGLVRHGRLLVSRGWSGSLYLGWSQCMQEVCLWHGADVPHAVRGDARFPPWELNGCYNTVVVYTACLLYRPSDKH